MTLRPLVVGAYAVATVAIARLVVGLASTAAAAVGVGPVPFGGRQWLMLAHVVSFCGTGVVLVVGGRRDRRAQALGMVFVLVGTAFFNDIIFGPLSVLPPPWRVIAEAPFEPLQVEAFTAAFIWAFVRDFPRTPDTDPLQRATTWGMRASVASGAVVFVMPLVTWLAGDARLTFLLSEYVWPAQFVLSAPAYVVLWRRARRSPVDERRRAMLLGAGLVVGMTPAAVWVLLAVASPAFLAAVPLSIAGWVLYPLFLTTPFTTAYAVLVRRALDVRLAARRAVQYVLARYTASALLAIPALALAASVWRARDRSLTELVTSGRWLALLALSVAGLAMLVTRRGVLDRIDRRFFREQYDARHILAGLVDRCRATRTRGELAEVLRVEIDRALHLETVDVYFLDANAGMLVPAAGDGRPLPASAMLVDELSRGPHGLDVDLAADRSFALALSDPERHWLADGGFRLLIPLREAGAHVIGCLALGDKRSELPFSREDRSLLAAVATAAEMTLAYQSMSAGSAAPRVPDSLGIADEGTAECAACGHVAESGEAVGGECAVCGGTLVPCALPRTVAAKFRVERRVGAGGMGVVYRGLDLQLGRAVAIKTLPYVSPEEAVRLRREARAMALVAHPHLALIYGAETSNGRPTLIFEYLAGGTLRDRLRHGPLDLTEALDVGVALASVLSVVHGAGILHRDVKPSNIGFTGDGVPKLLDFGLARILDAAVRGDGARAGSGPHHTPRHLPRPVSYTALRADSLAALTSEGAVHGTPSYMSPEALRGDPPDASFDLWGLALVLYEAIAGHHPLADDEFAAMRFAIAAGGPDADSERRRAVSPEIPDVRTRAPDAPAAVAQFFQRALSRDRGERPTSAREMEAQLRALRLARAERADALTSSRRRQQASPS